MPRPVVWYMGVNVLKDPTSSVPKTGAAGSSTNERKHRTATRMRIKAFLFQQTKPSFMWSKCQKNHMNTVVVGLALPIHIQHATYGFEC